MSIFSNTMLQMINEYRILLKKTHSQPERVKIQIQLNLKNPQLYRDEAKLYQLGMVVHKQLQNTLSERKQHGYYSYSGHQKFSSHLGEFLSGYVLENNKVIHRAQKASSAMIKSIQILSQSEDTLSKSTTEKIKQCNVSIHTMGTQEQHVQYTQTLGRLAKSNPGSERYSVTLHHFLTLKGSPAQAA